MNALPQEPDKAKNLPEDASAAAAMQALFSLGYRAIDAGSPEGSADEAADAIGATQTEDIEDTTISKCGDSGGATEFAQGIAGILEGFGLLNGTADSTESDETITVGTGMNIAADAGASLRLDTAASPEQIVSDASEDAVDQGAQAGMLKEEPLNSTAAESIALPQEELSSFENINSTGEVPQNARKAAKEEARLQPVGEPADKGAVEQPKQAVKAGADAENEGTQDRNSDAKTLTAETKMPAEQPVFASKIDVAVAAKTADATPVPQAALADNLDGIVERISTRSAEGKQEFEVELKPESLGKLSVKLVLDGDGMKAYIKTDNSATKSLLQNEVAVLEQMLKDKGIDVSQISVTHEAVSLGFTAQQQGKGQYESARSSKRTVLEGLESYDCVMAASALELLPSNSSVEFIA
ncbi:MAG: flagellar hook-length control protein FliK [Bacillota bacterium]